MFEAHNAYDSAITVFSPDGRLFQVEYALETVNRGSTILGIAIPEGVVLAAEERTSSRLQDPNFSWKILARALKTKTEWENYKKLNV